jgi:hypothetical protein
MIQVEQYTFEIDNGIPKEVVRQAQQSYAFEFDSNTPERVKEFIQALAEKLPHIERFKIEQVPFTGYELMLGGSKEKDLLMSCIYMVDVPVMQQVSPALSMYRIFKKRGKKGLVDYCKAKVNGTELSRVLEILNVHVFEQYSQEYNTMIEKIKQAKRIENDEAVLQG